MKIYEAKMRLCADAPPAGYTEFPIATITVPGPNSETVRRLLLTNMQGCEVIEIRNTGLGSEEG